VVFAYSLGTLLTYDLFLHPPQNRIIRDRYFITCVCQIRRVALRSKSGASNRILRGVPLRALARDKKTADIRETEHGHKGPYLPLIFKACGEDKDGYEYRDGVTSYGAFTYFVTKTLFDLGHDRNSRQEALTIAASLREAGP
jgi:hypothetical protein